jgi:predicted flap endonuclease-1-like 5' DNA nuclease
MIYHAAEIWAAMAGCLIFGALAGSLLYRTIALTGARRAQTQFIHGIDGVVRMFERMLMPWRGSVPATLPQTVPVPPPDFRHVVEVPEVHPPAEPDRHWEVPAAAQPAADIALLPSAYVAPFPNEEALAPEPSSGFQPQPLSAPRNGNPDPLHVITGLTKRHAARLAKIGIFHFSQIASWTPQEVAWVATYLGAGDVITSKDWVGQAVHFGSSDEPIREPEPKQTRLAAGKSKHTRKGAAKRGSSKGGAAKKAETGTDAGAAKPARRKRAASPKGAASQSNAVTGAGDTVQPDVAGEQAEGAAAGPAGEQDKT